MPWWSFAVGLVVAAAIRLFHDHLFDAYGAPFTLAVVVGSVLIGLITLRAHAGRDRKVIAKGAAE